MTIVTGGTISVEDCKKHEGYPDPQFAPTRKVRVEFVFANEEGSASQHAIVGDTASAEVARLLGGKIAAPKAVAPTLTGQSRTPEEIEAADKLKAASQGGTPGPAGAKKPPAQRKATAPAPKPEPAGSDPVLDGGGESAPATAGDGLEDLLAPEEQPKAPVTDADLNAAVGKKNKELKAPAKIRDLIATFGPADKKITLAQIAPEQRHDFLAKLEALT